MVLPLIDIYIYTVSIIIKGFIDYAKSLSSKHVANTSERKQVRLTKQCDQTMNLEQLEASLKKTKNTSSVTADSSVTGGCRLRAERREKRLRKK